MLNNEEYAASTSSETIQLESKDVLRDLQLLRVKKTAEKKELKKKLLEEENQIRKEKATISMNYLLKYSQKYSLLFLDKLQNQDINFNNNNINDKENKNPVCSKETTNKDVNGLNGKKENIIQPKYFEGKLFPYQLEGLAWLKILFENSVNGILADEMGLGKTIQIIALISSLIENKVKGPFLIVAPLSTISNWMSEFKKFAPKIPVVLFYGPTHERPSIYPKINHTYYVDGFPTLPVVITSYETPIKEGRFLQTFRWQYIIIDEGHRIKNIESQLNFHLKKLNSLNRLLLTGTPLQNNLTELWSLLHFLMPQIFKNMATFSDLFEINDFNESHKIIQQEKETNIISTIHGVLNPFMLRRLKKDVLKIVPKKEVLVYCPLSDLQRDLYKYVLQRNIAKLTGKQVEDDENIIQGRKRRKCAKKSPYYYPTDEDDITEESPDIYHEDLCIAEPKMKEAIHHQVNLLNPQMLMRKIINHPFTVHCPVVPGTREIVISEDVVTQSGKMMVLDAMLCKLKERGHKVLIFCTFTSILDFIEDYMAIRGYGYCRLDGTVRYEQRKQEINEFNTNPDIFVFLISTKAGGLGLNLTAADTVILFDRDWNPQNDLQAQDRCHRIGQTKPVAVYTLISKGTVDEYILNRATAKRRLEKIVIKKDQFSNPCDIKSVYDLKELEELVNSVDHKQAIQPNGFVLSDEELTKILDRSDLYKEMELEEN